MSYPNINQLWSNYNTQMKQADDAYLTKIDAMPEEKLREWYHVIKPAVDSIKRRQMEDSIRKLKGLPPPNSGLSNSEFAEMKLRQVKGLPPRIPGTTSFEQATINRIPRGFPKRRTRTSTKRSRRRTSRKTRNNRYK